MFGFEIILIRQEARNKALEEAALIIEEKASQYHPGVIKGAILSIASTIRAKKEIKNGKGNH